MPIYGVLYKKMSTFGENSPQFEQLELAIIEEWQNLGQHFIDRSINEWRRRLEKVVEKQGGRIEHFAKKIMKNNNN